MNNTGVKGARLRTIDITMIGLFCALGAVCAWISFPIAEIPITMQTFSVFLTLAVLAFGSLWFMAVYASGTGSIGLGAVLIKCVVPYLIPDAVKIALAVSVSGTLRKIMKNRAA